MAWNERHSSVQGDDEEEDGDDDDDEEGDGKRGKKRLKRSRFVDDIAAVDEDDEDEEEEVGGWCCSPFACTLLGMHAPFWACMMHEEAATHLSWSCACSAWLPAVLLSGLQMAAD